MTSKTVTSKANAKHFAYSNLALICWIVMLGASSASADWIDRTDNGGTVTASSQIHDGESKEMAFDNTTATKWLTLNTPTGWIQFQFPGGNQYVISRYSIASANDAPERDPKNWTLYGSNDGNIWTQVDIQADQTWTSRLQRREFTCADPGAYNYYRLDITSNNGASNLTGFSEMELLENTNSAFDPSPDNMAKGVATSNLTLSWSEPLLPNPTYRIYLDDSFFLVQNSDSSVLKSQQSETTYIVDTLDSFTTYYWRVNVIDGGTVYAGDIWQFQTEMPDIPCLSLMTDLDDDCVVSVSDLVVVASQWLSESCPAGPCADLDNSSRVDLADLSVVSQDWNLSAETIILNEIMADNEFDSTADPETNIPDNFGDYSDWIEIKNLGDVSQNLQGWHLTDDSGVLNKWTFPDVTIDPKGYLLVYATGRDLAASGQPLHTNFMLDNAGEYLALVRPDLTIAHEFNPFPSVDDNEAYGMTLLAGQEGLIASLLASPTPGQSNAEAVTAEEPQYSQSSGVFSSSFTVELSITDAGSEIRYTLDGSVPQLTSALYTGPLTITETTRIRARVFHPVRLPGPVVSRHYLFLAGDVQGFTSDLPIIVVENFGSGSIPSPTGDLQSIAVAVFEPDALSGRTSMTDAAEITARAGIRRRGRSTANNPKGNYKLEFWDEKDWDKDRPLLSMPSSSDWVLHAPYSFDRAMIRNAFIHQLSNDAGQYAVRTRYAEVFVNEGGGDLSNADYAGVYVVMEQIKRGSERVDITPMNPSDVNPPNVTGGYILAIDQADPGDTWFTTNVTGWTLPTGDGQYLIKYPQELEIVSGQINYARQYVDDLILTTYGSGFKDPVTGFRAYIDENAAIDHNLLNMLAKNVDALRLSTYLSKDRNEKLKFGPIWDFDRSMDSTDGRDDAYDTWIGTGDATNYFTHDWWSRFFQDDDFRLHYADRWYQLRKGAFSTSHVLELVDTLAAQIAEAQVRNFTRWPDVAPASWQGEVDHLKWWLQNRVAWVDSRMAIDFAPKPPLFNQDGGDVNAGFELTMASQGGGVSSYTDVELVSEGASVRAYAPTNNALGLTWTSPSFVPSSSWTNGATGTGVGYDTDPDYDPLIDTDMQSEIRNRTQSVLCRIEFSHDGRQIDQLLLQMKFDDGFVAYINGTEVCRSSNVTNDVPGSADAGSHEAGSLFDDFDISSFSNSIVTGTNILAIHGINSSIGSSDMLILPRLVARIPLPAEGNVWYTADGSDPRLFGGAVKAGAIEYAAPVVINHSVQIKARSYDPLWSALNETTFSVGPIAESIRITELMYHPADPNSEFIELMNIGTESVNLNLVKFTNGIDFTFPPVNLAPGEHVIVIREPSAFATSHPDFTGVIAGQYAGALDNAGERIRLADALDRTILDFSYKDSWYDITDGEGFSLVFGGDLEGDPNSWDEKSFWRASTFPGGSPGLAEEGLAANSIVFNEILAHSHASDPDWIELANKTDQDINLSGWFLTDDSTDLTTIRKYEIPANTILPRNGFLLFSEDVTFGSPALPVEKQFGLSEAGETVHLFSGLSGEVTGYYYASQKFEASETTVTMGRYEKPSLSSGYDFVRMITPTPLAANSDPLIPDVVITEMMVDPPAGADAEYLEVFNRSAASVTLMTLADTEAPQGVSTSQWLPWRIDGIDFVFDEDIVLAPGEKIIVAKNLTAFATVYGSILTPGTRVFGPYLGKLNNGGENIELQIPGDQEWGKERIYIPIEKIEYSNLPPWPENLDTGNSLTRIAAGIYADDPENWQAASPSPGL
jgi:hypothetical protein